MSVNTFDFTGADGSAIPVELDIQSGAAFEISSNKLKATALASSSAVATIDTGDNNGVVEATVSRGSDGEVALQIRQTTTRTAVRLILRSLGILILRTVDNGISTNINNSYTIPNYNDSNSYKLKAEFRDDNIKCYLDDVLIYDETVTFNQSSTVHGVIHSALDNTTDHLTIADSSLLPAVGEAPVLTVSGSQSQTLYLNGPIPTFTATATDAEDGDITASIIESGDTIDNTTEGAYTRTWTVTDSDANETTVTRTVSFVARPELVVTGDTEYTIVRGQTAPRPNVKFEDIATGQHGFATKSGWDYDTSATGTFETHFDYTNEQGASAERVTITYTVVEVPTITSTGVYNFVEEYGAETITVDGYTLKRFDSADGETFGYGFENDVTVSATSLNLIDNTELDPVQIARIETPFDSLSLCKKATVSVEVTTDIEVENSQIQVAFGDFRNEVKQRVLKDTNGLTTRLEFDIFPLHDSMIRMENSGNGYDADRFMDGDSKFFEIGLSANIDLLVFFKFGANDVVANITNIDASMVIGKSIFGEDGKFLRGKDSFDVTPYRLDDPVNKGLPENPVISEPVFTYDIANKNASHLITVAGDDWVQVASVTGVKIGHLCVIGRVSHNNGATFNDISLTPVSSYDQVRTRDNIGTARYVAEVDSVNNRIRMSAPAIASYDSIADDGVDYADRLYSLICCSAEYASLAIGGNDAEDWRFSPVNGITKRRVNAVDYGNHTGYYRVDNVKADVTIGFNYMIPQNNFHTDYSNGERIDYGERVANATFALPTPIDFTGLDDGPNNADDNHILMLPSKRHAVHTYLTKPVGHDGVNYITCSRIVSHDLSQWSVSPAVYRPDKERGLTNSPRASGFSAACMVRKEELDECLYTGIESADIQGDLDRAETAIPHAIMGYATADQFMAHDFLTDLDDQTSKENYYLHQMFNQFPVIVNGGSGYTVGDTLELTCTNRLDTHSATVYAVEAVDSNGAITKAFTTRNGQHKTDPSNANHVPHSTSGTGTGAAFNTVGLFNKDDHSIGNVLSYPAAAADSGFEDAYAGSIPMGAVFTIPQNWDLRAEWERGIAEDISRNGKITQKWSYEFYAVCCAVQKYGLIFCDAGSFTPIIADKRIQGDQRDRLLNAGSATYRNVTILRRIIRPVLNFTPTHHIKTEQELKPEIELIGDSTMTVSNDWQDAGASVFSPLHGYQTVYSNDAIDRASEQPQTLNYVANDDSGYVSDILQRTVTLLPPPDTTAPVITLTPSNTTYNLTVGDAIPSIDTSTDDDSAVTFSDDVQSVNRTVRTYTSTDASNNTSTVVVTFNFAYASPTLTLSSSTTNASASEQVTITATATNADTLVFGSSEVALSGTGATRTFAAPSLTTPSSVTISVTAEGEGGAINESITVHVAAEVASLNETIILNEFGADELYLNIDNVFAVPLQDKLGDVLTADAIQNIEYFIGDKRGSAKLSLSLNNGVQIQDKDAIVCIHNSALNFVGEFTHQLVVTNNLGQRLPPLLSKKVKIKQVFN
ncbi:immunoglobulin-like domain-containing protein [Glaciecola sp. KUL10]|uniref:immunoglobulin-like domain-containing protein n=1 Tax=Glaciecola sp. (strain KUL10) TaxID=2161813 RepID=UPI000D78733B|nr:immunoglobulin-like domain-containing protein [Glaciecola sp. KUL10]GBL02924.1 LPXTG-domain-containing protein cell wall anchor domain [Glaciecola sp. KUL10]